MKILIADDDRELTGYIETSLSARGCEVITALDAMQAMHLIMQHEPDVVLLDVEMPGGTGRNVLRNIRRKEQTVNIPVVVFSGSTDPFLHNEMVNLGADGFIEKPVNPDALFDIFSWLWRRGGECRRGASR